jgi:Domain of unknown function (DUF1922)
LQSAHVLKALAKGPSVKLLLQCSCGEHLIATEGMAGSQIACVCGRRVPVPSLDEMRRRTGEVGDEDIVSAVVSDEPLQQPHTLLIYGLAVGWMCFAGLPLLLVSIHAGGAAAAMGAVLWIAGNVWLFTQIFSGNPVAALVVLVIPIVGPFLAFQFIIDHFLIARWPLLCQVAGLFLWLAGVFGNMSR